MWLVVIYFLLSCEISHCASNVSPGRSFGWTCLETLETLDSSMAAMITSVYWDLASVVFCSKTWMNVSTYGTSTGFNQADLHHVQERFRTNCISCLTGSNDHIHYKKCKVLWYSLNWDIFGQLYCITCWFNPFLNLDAICLYHCLYICVLQQANKSNNDHFKPCPLYCCIITFCRFGSRDCGFAVEERELDVFPEARHVIDLCGDPDIEEYLQQAVEQHGLQQPQDWKTASELYITLKEIAVL